MTVQNSTTCIRRASLLGLRSLLAYTREQPNVSTFYMHHADRLDPALQRYIPTAALSGLPPQAFLEDALEDDRLARRLPAVIENYRGERALLEAAPWDTWQRISACFDGLSPAGLRDDVLHSTHACDGYVTNKSLRPLADYPWRLGSGDLEENIRELKAMPNSPSPDLCTTLVKQLLDDGYPESLGVEIARVIGEAPNTTAAVERIHGSLSAIHRDHPGLATALVQVRAQLHACRALFNENRDDKREHKLAARIAKAERSLDKPATGRNLLFRDMMLEATELLVDPPGDLAKQTMQLHSAWWQALSMQEQEVYAEAARDEAARNRPIKEAELQDLKDQLTLFKERLRREREVNGVVNTIGSCRFTEEDMRALGQRLENEETTEEQKEAYRKALTTSPGNLEPYENQHFESLGGEDRPPVAKPTWLKVICHNGGDFGGTVFCHSGGSAKAWKFLFSLENPLTATFLEMHCLRPPSVAPGPVPLRAGLARMKHTWKYAIGASVVWSDLRFAEDGSDIEVIPRATYEGHCRVIPNADAIPWALWAAQFDDEKTTTSTPTRRPTVEPGLLEEFPWLVEFFPPPGHGGGGGAHGGGVGHGALGLGEARELTEEEIAAVWQAVLEKRHDLVPLHSSEDNFVVFARGGKWTAEHKRQAVDVVRCIAKSGAPRAWCRYYGMKQMKSFAINLYGEDGCVALASEVKRRYEYFYKIWWDAPDDDWVYTQEHINGYAEDRPWNDWCRAQSVESRAFDRLMEVRRLSPRLAH